ncbi:MAG: hypothetical protein AAB606_04915 [Patescibacteria group bacterium]
MEESPDRSEPTFLKRHSTALKFLGAVAAVGGAAGGLAQTSEDLRQEESHFLEHATDRTSATPGYLGDLFAAWRQDKEHFQGMFDDIMAELEQQGAYGDMADFYEKFGMEEKAKAARIKEGISYIIGEHEFVRAARAYEKAGEQEKAVFLYEKAVAQLAGKKDFTGAAVCAEKAGMAELAKGYWIKTGEKLLEGNDPDLKTAQEYFRKAGMDEGVMNMKLAMSALQTHDSENALQYLLLAIINEIKFDAEQKVLLTHFAYNTVAYSQQRYFEAAELLQGVGITSSEFRLRLAQIAERNGDLDSAIGFYEVVGDYEKASECMERLAVKEAESEKAKAILVTQAQKVFESGNYIKAANLFRDAGEEEKAKEVLMQGFSVSMQKGYSDVDFYYGAVRYLQQAGMDEKTANLKVADEMPKTETINKSIAADLYETAGKADEAKRLRAEVATEFEQKATGASDNVFWMLDQSRALFEEVGMPEDAKRVTGKLVAALLKDKEYYRAYALHTKSLGKSAQEAGKLIAETAKGNGDFHIAAEYYEQIGDTAAAKQMWIAEAKAAYERGDEAMAAEAYVKAGMGVEAKAMYGEAGKDAELDHNYLNAEMYYRLSGMYPEQLRQWTLAAAAKVREHGYEHYSPNWPEIEATLVRAACGNDDKKVSLAFAQMREQDGNYRDAGDYYGLAGALDRALSSYVKAYFEVSSDHELKERYDTRLEILAKIIEIIEEMQRAAATEPSPG